MTKADSPAIAVSPMIVGAAASVSVPPSDPTEPIDNVIFDFGNVLVTWDPAAALQSRYSEDLINRFFQEEESGFWSANRLGDSGAPLAEVVALIRQGHGDLMGDMMQWYLDHFEDSLRGLIPGARQLVADLKAAGVHVYGLSNWNPENFPVVWAAFPLLHELEDKVISGYIHQAKPGREIFDTALAQFGVSGARSVFIDDSPANVVAAQAYGINGILQTSPQFVRSELIRMGVPIPPVRQA